MKTLVKTIAIATVFLFSAKLGYAQALTSGPGGVRVVPGNAANGTRVMGPQSPVGIRPGGPIQHQPFARHPSAGVSGNQRPANSPSRQSSMGLPAYFPPSYDPWGRPTGPAIVAPNNITGINPLTGGLNTGNFQIDHSAFDPAREQSKHNGTMEYVQRPIYGQNGNIVGYQEGHVWRNSFTGQEHGELKNYTPNQFGGINENTQIRSLRPAPNNRR